LSADGNTAIVDGNADNSATGAAWVYTRSGGVWTQQGSKLVGTGAVGSAQQGWSVALSGDGNTAIVGGDGDNSVTGAAWVYTRSNSVWISRVPGAKLVGTGAVGSAGQGSSVVTRPARQFSAHRSTVTWKRPGLGMNQASEWAKTAPAYPTARKLNFWSLPR
jgi:hypothetical protein